MSDVLLTYGWVRSSYAALRNLDKHGVSVCVSDSNRVGMCQWSRLKDGFEIYPSYYANEDKFISSIVKICETKTIRLIMPSHNETEILARHRSRLPAAATALLPDEAHCALFNNKARAYELAKSVGVPVPARIDYKDPGQIEALLVSARIEKSVIKMLTGNSSKGVHYAETPQAAQALVEKLIAENSLQADRYPQIEERVSGEGWGCSVLYWRGEKVASFTHHRLREKVSTGGTSTLRESARHEGLEVAAKKIFDAVGWHGLAMCEFKVCPETGHYWFIEVNPRMWGSIPLAISAGVEFPYLAWLCATSGIDAARKYHLEAIVKIPWRGRWLLGDGIVSMKLLTEGKILSAWTTIFQTEADAIDDFYWDDPLAFLGEVGYYGAKFLKTLSTNPADEGMVR